MIQYQQGLLEYYIVLLPICPYCMEKYP